MTLSRFPISLAKFFLCAAVFCVALVTPSVLFPFIVGKYVWFRVMVLLALAATLVALFFRDNFTAFQERWALVSRSPFFIAAAIFIGVFLLAGVFGIDPMFSFWSNFERGEGGFQYLMLFVFFSLLLFLFRERRDWDRIFFCFFVASLLVIFYGVGATLKYVDAGWTMVQTAAGPDMQLSGAGGPWFQTFKSFVGPSPWVAGSSSVLAPGYRFQGSFGNAAYVAAYLLFAIFYGGYMLSSRYRGRMKSAGAIFVMVCTALFGVFFWLAATRGAFIGLLAALVVGGGYLGFQRVALRRWLFGGIAALLVLFSIGVMFRNSAVIQKIPGARIFDISFATQTFQDRTFIWTMAWRGFLERPLLGWGPEQFLTVFYKHFDERYFVPAKGFGAWFDRAHSVFFDALVGTGFLGFASYCSMFFIVFYFFIRKKDSRTPMAGESALSRAILLMIPVAYLVQGLILFDVLVISLNVFFMLAWFGYQFLPSLNSSSSHA